MPQTDKIGHGYQPTYERVFDLLASDHRQGDTLRMVEVGVATGDSLSFWAELASDQPHFRTLELVGVDNNPVASWNVPWGNGERFVTSPSGRRPVQVRLYMVHADQANPGLDLLISEQAAKPFPFLPAKGPWWDLIVDDASHQASPTRQTWWTLWPRLRGGGAYVIEDWSHGGADLMGVARELLDVFDERMEGYGEHTEVESIEYRPGLIIIWKRPARA